MKIGRAFGPIFLLAAFIFLHPSLQKNVFELGASWTFSFFVPYIVQLIVLFLLMYEFVRFFKEKSRVFKRFIGILVFVAGGIIVFAFNPVYEGDLSGDHSEIIAEINGAQVFDEGLNMVALPGCPYCYGKIEILNTLKERNADLPIHVWLVKEDSTTIENYKDNLNASIHFSVADEGKLLAKLAEGHFPAFFFRKTSGEVLYWKNKNFGTSALDWIEDCY